MSRIGSLGLILLLCSNAAAFSPQGTLLPSFVSSVRPNKFLAIMKAKETQPSPTANRQAHGSSRRSIISGGVGALLTVGSVPKAGNAFFGIGEQFQVYKEEDVGEFDGKLPRYGSKDIMRKKKHGTSEEAVMRDLRWGCDRELADKICNFNRHFAEHAGYFAKTKWLSEVGEAETTYFDSVTGKPLFIAPRGRSFAEFVRESKVHGWPSFRDEEVVWDNVRCLRDGECVSLTGTHLGHNLPDKRGNRYCINLVSIAGTPSA